MSEAMQTPNPGSVDQLKAKATSETQMAANELRDTRNAELTADKVATETGAAADLRGVNDGKAAAATAPRPAGFTTNT